MVRYLFMVKRHNASCSTIRRRNFYQQQRLSPTTLSAESFGNHSSFYYTVCDESGNELYLILHWHFV